ncbi:Zinc finger CCCH domain-containing protein 7B, partial [Ophiophagus hannah]
MKSTLPLSQEDYEGLHEKALEDSEKALGFNKENIRALFRKARCLSELGRHKEAYECNSRCLLSLPHQDSETFSVLSNGLTSALPNQTNGLGSIDDIETDSSVVLQCIVTPSVPSVTASKANAFPSIDLDTKSLPTSLPATNLLPSTDVASIPESDNVDDFTEGEVLGDELDSFLDSIADGSQYPLSLVRGAIPANLPSEVPQLIPVFPGGTPLLPPVVTANIPVSTPLPPASFGLVMEATKQLSSSSVLDTFEAPVGSRGMSPLDSLDSLDLLPYTESRLDMLDAFGTKETSTQEPRQPAGIQKSLPLANQTGPSTHTTVPKVVELLMSQPELVMSNTTLLVKNPLVSTHIFKQACHICYPKTGPKAGDYTYREGMEHKCKRDILLGRRRISEDKTWKRIRPRPTKTNFDCKYGDNCTFAYHQEEIDVWTEERKGTLNRDLLFDPLGGIKRGNLTITKILKEHQGIFTFLCEEDCPMPVLDIWVLKIIITSSLTVTYQLSYEQKMLMCLVHIVRSTSLKYSKIRQFQEHFQFDVCRHEVRYGCLREDSCHFAHSFIELKVWLLQQYSGMTHEDIVQESKKFWQQMEAHAGKANNNMASVRTPISNTFDLQMKFVCGQCWRNGQVVEPDKDLKYCSAKAHHCLIPIRKKFLKAINFAISSQLCIHAQNGRKCQYVGNCSFAHSPEEREMWTFMKENKILDMQQTYDMWLKKHNPGKPGEGTPLTSREGEKQIQMPTDYADMMGYHCWLCGKNSNSKKQWQQHIQSEKHKEKVFTSDNDSSCWNYRFPMGEFRLCERFQKTKGCPEGEKCNFAHGQDELTEWLDRREVMKQKLAKARKDMLLCPRDDDFGKYNFLLRDSI